MPMDRFSSEASAERFRELENQLGPELFAKLEEEHIREIDAMWNEQMQLRAELERVVALMQNEILPREKMMHDMIEKMQSSYEAATMGFHQQLSQHFSAAGDRNKQSEAQRAQLIDPLKEMEMELDRISKLLSHEVARPDIRGWQPPSSSSGGFGLPIGKGLKSGFGGGTSLGSSPSRPVGGGFSSPASGFGGSPANCFGSSGAFGGSATRPMGSASCLSGSPYGAASPPSRSGGMGTGGVGSSGASFGSPLGTAQFGGGGAAGARSPMRPSPPAGTVRSPGGTASAMLV
mmetsp:Transcript_85187/g.214836  ORF Transcript_85187/g.214836 Transcript_85187/m.214836 type:complete len:290 (-) Transcript_85187:40-909(-)